MTDIGACMYKRIYVHIQGLGDEKGVQHLSRKGRDRLLVRRQPRRGVDPVSFEVPLVADESRLVKGAVLLQHDAPHFFDIQLPMVVLTKVTSDIEFVRVEACQLSRLEVRHWCILCESRLEARREVGQDPVPEVKGEKSYHDE